MKIQINNDFTLLLTVRTVDGSENLSGVRDFEVFFQNLDAPHVRCAPAKIVIDGEVARVDISASDVAAVGRYLAAVTYTAGDARRYAENSDAFRIVRTAAEADAQGESVSADLYVKFESSGKNGLSAFELAVQNGYVGTFEQWLASGENAALAAERAERAATNADKAAEEALNLAQSAADYAEGVADEAAGKANTAAQEATAAANKAAASSTAADEAAGKANTAAQEANAAANKATASSAAADEAADKANAAAQAIAGEVQRLDGKDSELDSRVAELERGGTGGGATPEQVTQIEINKNNIATLEESKRDNLRTSYTAAFVPKPTVYDAAGSVVAGSVSLRSSLLPNVVLVRTPYTAAKHFSHVFSLEIKIFSSYNAGSALPVASLIISARGTGNSFSYQWGGSKSYILPVRMLVDGSDCICFAIGGDDKKNVASVYSTVDFVLAYVAVFEYFSPSVIREGWELRQGDNLSAALSAYSDGGATVLHEAAAPDEPVVGAWWEQRVSLARYIQEVAPAFVGIVGAKNQNVKKIYAIALPAVIGSTGQHRIKLSIEIINFGAARNTWSFDLSFIYNGGLIGTTTTMESADSQLYEVAVGVMDERLCVFFKAALYTASVRVTRLVYDHYNGNNVDLLSAVNDFIFYDAFDEEVYESLTKQNASRQRLSAETVTNPASLEE